MWKINIRLDVDANLDVVGISEIGFGCRLIYSIFIPFTALSSLCINGGSRGGPIFTPLDPFVFEATDLDP